MAIGFDESDDYYTVADAAELTLQNGDWCIGMWTRVVDNAGTVHQCAIGTGALLGNNAINVMLQETDNGAGGDNDCWWAYVQDGDGTAIEIVSTTTTGGDGKDRLIVVQRNAGSSQVEMWFCEPGAGASLEDSGADTNLGAVDGGIWYIGATSGLDATYFYGSVMAELFKGDFCLSQAQIEALADGLPIKTLAKQASLTLDLYLPMWEADATLLDYSNSGNNGTRNSAPTTETHPPICTPVKHRRMRG